MVSLVLLLLFSRIMPYLTNTLFDRILPSIFFFLVSYVVARSNKHTHTRVEWSSGVEKVRAECLNCIALKFELIHGDGGSNYTPMNF